MSRLAIVALFALAAPVRAEWVVEDRIELPLSGVPIDLAPYASEDEENVRFVLSGTYTFLLDGAELDAMGGQLGERHDPSLAMVALPPGARVIDEDRAAHRYTIEAPRSASMPIALRIAPLAMRHLITASEARANLQGSIALEHVAQPPTPAPSAVVVERASSVPIGAWLAGLLGFGALGGAAAWVSKRRRDPAAVLSRRAHRARAAIARECAALGPAFDPVSSSATRLLEATEQAASHDRALRDALSRTSWTQAAGDRAALAERTAQARSRLQELVLRLESIATQLAGRRADASRAVGIDALVSELEDDFDAAASAEDELAHLAH
jgi:hypothetical protein